MNQSIQNLIIFICVLTTLAILSCVDTPKTPIKPALEDDSHLGEISLKVTGSAAAQPFFKEGLLYLHSFEYEDARAAFLEAQQADSTFAMAYWGEAMTYHRSLWQRQEKEKAIAALQKFGATPTARKEKIKTELEQDFFEAAHILFGTGTKYERDLAYRDFMETLVKKYPENHEVSALYAISILGSARNGRDEELYNKCAKIVDGIIKENPHHPGALHYLIHSYDDPNHAHLAKSAADNYSKVAPDAAHALHMPSHIYVALGLWDDVVNSNIASWNASIKRLNRKGLKDKEGSYHAYNWLQYGLLQREETEQATELLTKMVSYTNEHPSKGARSYLVAMKGGHLVETGAWDSEVAEIKIETEDLNIIKRAAYAYLEGSKAYHRSKKDSLEIIIQDMEKDRIKTSQLIGENGFPMCSTAGFASKPPNQLDIDMAQVMELELKAYLADLEGNTQEVAAIYEQAIALDETLNYSFGPPLILQPVHEAYGYWLLAQEKYEQASVVFTKALERQPRRLRTLLGQQKAAKMLGNKEVEKQIEQELAISLKPKERKTIL